MRRSTELGLLVAANGLTGGVATPVLRWRRTLAVLKALVIGAAVSTLAVAVVVAATRWTRRGAATAAPQPANPATNGAGPGPDIH